MEYSMGDFCMSLVILAGLWYNLTVDQSGNEAETMDQQLAEVLAGKTGSYMLPFYWQQGNHTDQIPAQIESIYQSGCRAFCVESRTHPEFGADGWWRDMDLILAEAKKR